MTDKTAARRRKKQEIKEVTCETRKRIKTNQATDRNIINKIKKQRKRWKESERTEQDKQRERESSQQNKQI